MKDWIGRENESKSLKNEQFLGTREYSKYSDQRIKQIPCIKNNWNMFENGIA